MRTRFERLSKPELDYLIKNCNFTDDEVVVITMSSKGKSEKEIAFELNLSVFTVPKIKQRILSKIRSFLEVADILIVNITVNGEPVSKEELKELEIKNEAVKQILTEKLTNI